MQKRKNSKLKKFLFATLLLLLSISVPFQVNAKTNQNTNKQNQIPIWVNGHLKAKVGDTKTYVITSSTDAGSAYYYTIINSKSYAYKYKVETGTKFTIKVANLTANPYLDYGMTGFYNITITKKDNTNMSAYIITAGYSYVPFLTWGFDNSSEADIFTKSYDSWINKYPLIDEFQATMYNTNEILFFYETGNSSYIRFEYSYINWKTGWLDKCLLQTKTVGPLKVVKEVVIQPLGSSSANGMEATSILILFVPAILILERRKKKW